MPDSPSCRHHRDTRLPGFNFESEILRFYPWITPQAESHRRDVTLCVFPSAAAAAAAAAFPPFSPLHAETKRRGESPTEKCVWWIFPQNCFPRSAPFTLFHWPSTKPRKLIMAYIRMQRRPRGREREEERDWGSWANKAGELCTPWGRLKDSRRSRRSSKNLSQSRKVIGAAGVLLRPEESFLRRFHTKQLFIINFSRTQTRQSLGFAVRMNSRATGRRGKHKNILRSRPEGPRCRVRVCFARRNPNTSKRELFAASTHNRLEARWISFQSASVDDCLDGEGTSPTWVAHLGPSTRRRKPPDSRDRRRCVRDEVFI